MKTSKMTLTYMIGLMVTAGISNLDAHPLRSHECGSMCHAPMAWQGGHGAMAWCSLGEKTGTINHMKRRFVANGDNEQEWKQFYVALEKWHQSPSHNQKYAVHKAFNVLKGSNSRDE